MDLTIFARFHARPGQADAVAAAIAEVVSHTRAEAACLGIEAYRSIQDPDLFHIHSRWVDEPSFEVHAGLAHTDTFLNRMQPLIDHPLEVSRTRPFDPPA
jgi:quinol monooxygenase YgiN